jgi:hypothetical protein
LYKIVVVVINFYDSSFNAEDVEIHAVETKDDVETEELIKPM